jgi:hypothetical protein
MAETYQIRVITTAGDIRNTRYKGMARDQADTLAEQIRFATDGNGIAAGLQVVRESDGEVYSEWEW